METEWLDLEGVSLRAVSMRTDRKVQKHVHNTALRPIQKVNNTKEAMKNDLYREYNRQRRRSLERLRKRNAVEPQYPTVGNNDSLYPAAILPPQSSSPVRLSRMPLQVADYRSSRVMIPSMSFNGGDSSSPVWDHQVGIPQQQTLTRQVSTVSESDKLISAHSMAALPPGSPPLLF